MADTEHELIRRAVNGDAEAGVALLDLHGGRLRRRLRGRIGRRYRAALDAEDILQVTYLEVFMQIGRFDPAQPGSFAAWLNRIAENNLRDAIKGLDRAKRPPRDKQIAPAGQDSYVTLLGALGSVTTPSSAAGRHEAKGLLDAAIARLPDDYAAVVRLMDLEGRSGPETADVMGRSRGAVHMLRARAHDRLRELPGTGSRFFSKGG